MKLADIPALPEINNIAGGIDKALGCLCAGARGGATVPVNDQRCTDSPAPERLLQASLWRVITIKPVM